MDQTELDERLDHARATGLAQGLRRSLNLAQERAAAAFMRGDDEEARRWREFVREIEPDVKSLDQRLDIYAQAALEKARAKKR